MGRESKMEIKETLYEQETETRRIETSERLKVNRLASAEQEEIRKSDFLEKLHQREDIKDQIKEEQEKNASLRLKI